MMLGYWEEAGLDVEFANISGSGAATQLVFSGSAQFTLVSPEGYMAARQSDPSGIAIYNHTRDAIYTIAVVDDSPVQDLSDLRGKTVGVLSLSSGAYPVARAMLASVGLDPDNDVEWVAVGMGPQAAAALGSDQVDALALWDFAYAQLEGLGYQFRHFSTEETYSLLALMVVANEDFVRDHPSAAAKFAQGIAKGALFTQNNPEAAVRLHWERFPESRPTGIPEDEALAEAVRVVKSRIDKTIIEGREIPLWGAFTDDEWEVTQNFLLDNGVLTEARDVSFYYNADLLDEINDFDKEAILEQARNQ